MMQIFLIKFLLEFDLISKLYGLNLTNLSVEIFIADSFCDCLLSRPIWGVWIEIIKSQFYHRNLGVSPQMGRVD